MYDNICTCLVIRSGCEAWQLIQLLREGKRSQSDDEQSGRIEVTEKSNEQENVENVTKFAGIDQH